MRIRGGNAKGRPIDAPKGLNTRPTADKVKEAIFNVLASKIEEAYVLDLCAGTGNLSLEALSRGAKAAVLVEKNEKAVRVIQNNIRNIGFKEQTNILKMDVLRALASLHNEQRAFDIIFFDPPYEAGLYEPVFEFLSTNKDILNENGVFVVECSSRKSLPTNIEELELRKESTYGDTKITYYQF